MITFKELKTFEPAFKITENDVEKDVVFAGLVYTNETFTIQGSEFNTEDEPAPLHILLSEFDEVKATLKEAYSDYHICTKAEIDALKQLLCKYVPDSSSLETLRWKDPEEIPGGLTPKEFLEKYLGVGMDYMININNSEPTIYTDRTVIALDETTDLYRKGGFHVVGGITTPFTFGSTLAQPCQILLVKNRE